MTNEVSLLFVCVELKLNLGLLVKYYTIELLHPQPLLYFATGSQLSCPG